MLFVQLCRRFPWRSTCFIVYDERCATVFPIGEKVDFPLHERRVGSVPHAHEEGNFRAKAGKCHDACRKIAFKPSRKRFGEANALQVGQPAMASKRVDVRFVGVDEGSTLVMGAYRLLGKPMEGGAQVRRLVGISRKRSSNRSPRRLVRLRKTRLFEGLHFRQCKIFLNRVDFNLIR